MAERANSYLHQTSSFSILTQASSRSYVGSFSSGLSNDRPPLSINTSLRSISGSGSSVFSVFRRSAASQSSSSFATTCPSSLSHLHPCEESVIEAATGCCSSEHEANFIASRPQQGVEHSPPSSPVATTSRTSVSSPSLHRMPSSLSHASSGTSSSNSSGSTSINTELLQRLDGGTVSVDASTAAAYVAHLRLDARARRALHHSNTNRLGRVDEELDIGSENREGEPIRKRKGKKLHNGDSSPNQYIVRVRTGRGGAGIAYQKDGIDAVDPGASYPNFYDDSSC